MTDIIYDSKLIAKSPASVFRDDLREVSGHVSSADPLVNFLYLLMRDEVTPGVVAKILEDSIDEETTVFTNGWLASYAGYVAKILKKPVDDGYRAAAVLGSLHGPFAFGENSYALIIKIDGLHQREIHLPFDKRLNHMLDINEVVDSINEAFEMEIAFHDGYGRLLLQSPIRGPASAIDLYAVKNAAYNALGLTVGKYEGRIDEVTTDKPKGEFVAETVSISHFAATLSSKEGPFDLNSLNYRLFVEVDDNEPIIIGLVGSSLYTTEVACQINTAVDANIAFDDGSGRLLLQSTITGRESCIKILDIDDNAYDVLGLEIGESRGSDA